MTVGPAEITAYATAYAGLRSRCRMIIPSCREGHLYFHYLAEARAYMALLLAQYAVQVRRIKETL